MRHLEPFVEEHTPKLLRDVESSWQPSDYSPDLSTEEGFEYLRELRREAEALCDDTVVTLVGDMITEEALPSYSAWISPLEGFGAQQANTAWGAWNKGWSAEENRHGDILNRYLYLSGRVNMREIEVTVQHLIRDGGDVKADNDPYRTFVYTSFQEIATRISHMNVAQRARQAGADILYNICSRVAGDEHRHARAYKLFVEKIFECDQNEMMIAIGDMMKKKITMPAMYMRERGGQPGDCFEKFEAVATRSGIYTGQDYVEILESLIKHWNLADRTGLNEAATKAQDYLCGLPERYRKLMTRFKPRPYDGPITFTWMDVPRTHATK
jgi:acyl-[acyl-carrier-protein] desaturase